MFGCNERRNTSKNLLRLQKCDATAVVMTSKKVGVVLSTVSPEEPEQSLPLKAGRH